jgi:hypothetical protein
MHSDGSAGVVGTSELTRQTRQHNTTQQERGQQVLK